MTIIGKTIWQNHFICWELNFFGRFSNFSYLSWIFQVGKFYLLQIIYNCNDQNLLDITSIFMSVFSSSVWLITDTHTQIHAHVHIHLSAGKSVQKLWGFLGTRKQRVWEIHIRKPVIWRDFTLKWLLIWNQELRVWMGDYKMLCRSFRNQKDFFGTFWGS